MSSGLSSATVVNYLADLRAFFRWRDQARGESVSPFSLDASDIEEYCAFLRDDQQHATATVNRRLQALRKFYSFAQDAAWTEANPADGVALLSETVSARSRFLTWDDIARLLTVVQTGRRRWADRDQAILQAFIGAGLKLSELTQLRLADVHLDTAEPYLEVRDSSGAMDRRVPLQPEVAAALRAYLGVRRADPGVEHLFLNRDARPLSTRSVQRLLRHYARAAELPELTTQALRYLYARKMYEANQDPEAVARLLGHRHLATTIRYLRPGPDQGHTAPTRDAPERSSLGNRD